jgi:hypothetical protein
MPELNAEQRLRDDAIVRGIIAQAQREAAQAVLDAVTASAPDEVSLGASPAQVARRVQSAARAAAARYGAGTAAGESTGLAVTADGLAGIAKAAAEGGRAVGQADARADLARAWQEGHIAGEIDAHAPPNKYPTPNPYVAAGGDGR